MVQTYLVQNDAEATRAARRLKEHGFEVDVCPTAVGYLMSISGPPSVEVEETLLRNAPSVHRA